MRKLRNDSSWNRLTYEQRDTPEGWLFDENLGYAEIFEPGSKVFAGLFTPVVAAFGHSEVLT